MPVQTDTQPDRRLKTGQGLFATHKIAQHGAQPETFVISRQQQVCQEIQRTAFMGKLGMSYKTNVAETNLSAVL